MSPRTICNGKGNVEGVSGEEWRAVEGWPYEVSSLGRVRRSAPGKLGAHPHGRVGRILASGTDASGYQNVRLSDAPRIRTARVQYLVAAAFLPPKPSPRHVLDHINRDKADNRMVNLRWVTPRGNIKNSARFDTRQAYGPPRSRWAGELANPARLTWSKVAEIRRRYANDEVTQAALAAEYGVAVTTVSKLLRGQSWRAQG